MIADGTTVRVRERDYIWVSRVGQVTAWYECWAPEHADSWLAWRMVDIGLWGLLDRIAELETTKPPVG